MHAAAAAELQGQPLLEGRLLLGHCHGAVAGLQAVWVHAQPYPVDYGGGYDGRADGLR